MVTFSFKANSILIKSFIINIKKFNSLFFFLISNKDVYSKILPHAENHKAEIRSTEKDDKKQKEKILITKKGVKEHRERITRGESPSPRPIKKGATKRSQ